MKQKWLAIKVEIIYLLRRLRIIPDVWYQSEIDLAKLKADELFEFFNKKTVTLPVDGGFDKIVNETLSNLQKGSKCKL